MVVVLTGAGISAESGLATFRGPDGLWEGHRPEDVATPEAFLSAPELVQRFYDDRRAALATVEPNAAHRALARLEHALGDAFLLVTQNIDDLHERAGSRRVLHMHGRLKAARCTECGESTHWDGTLVDEPPCPFCSQRALRPDVVWFGEIPYGLSEIDVALRRVRVFVSIGTSGNVYPAAGFASFARAVGARTVELNLEPSLGIDDFVEHQHGPATQVVPAWVDGFLAEREA
ncbi:NAD-dependent deacylase [Nocardioides terrisoli]|uniref:NAD-dependent deacylase n=1 Tax=Nocardioides terrisoli TaxID=3388267 RepID=UPI00287B9626|nr:NAD-dependent deacylase [Nocardioides marmorisolisilvae]